VALKRAARQGRNPLRAEDAQAAGSPLAMVGMLLRCGRHAGWRRPGLTCAGL